MPVTLTLVVRPAVTFDSLACSDNLTSSDFRPCSSGGLVVRS
jgi:hypothetical protein